MRLKASGQFVLVIAMCLLLAACGANPEAVDVSIDDIVSDYEAYEDMYVRIVTYVSLEETDTSGTDTYIYTFYNNKARKGNKIFSGWTTYKLESQKQYYVVGYIRQPDQNVPVYILRISQINAVPLGTTPIVPSNSSYIPDPSPTPRPTVVPATSTEDVSNIKTNFAIMWITALIIVLITGAVFLRHQNHPLD